MLKAAGDLFYAEGIHTVGVDRIVAEAHVTKATFYRHFPSKDELVRAYLDQRFREHAAWVEAAAFHREGSLEAILTVFDLIGDHLGDPSFRGCPFINTAVEYPDPTHPVTAVIAAQRSWLRTLFTRLLFAAGHPQPEQTARMLVLLRDGGITGGYLDGADTVRSALRQAVRILITATPPAAEDQPGAT